MKKNKSLIFQLGFFIVIMSSIVLVSFGIYQFQSNSVCLQEKAETSLNMAADRLSASLSLPLFTFNKEGIENIIYSEMNEPSIVGIYLELPWDSKRSEFWYHKDGQTVIKTNSKAVDEHYLSATRDIVYENENLGSLHVQMTDKFMEKELRNLLKSIVLQIFIVDLILIASVIVFLKFKVIDPIDKLKKIAVKVSSGKLDNKVAIKSDNEIGELSRAFNKMTDELKKSNDRLKEYNLKLEKKVEERTKLLDEKNSELEETLEDFYTLRLGMQRDLEKGTIESENKKIKKKLDDLKAKK